MDSADLPIYASRFIYGKESKNCKRCYKKMDNVSTFLRHVSHQKECLSEYGEDFIEAVRKASRKKSKNDWAEANSEMVKAKKKEKPRKRYYVLNKEKYSEYGRGFVRVFTRVFDKVQKHAEQWLKDESRKLFLLSSDEVDKAIDKAFDEGLSNATIQEFRDFHGENEGKADLDYAFSKIENCFDIEVACDNGDKVYHWHECKRKDVFDRLFDYSLNKAFLALYNEDQFKNWTKNAKDVALDEVFLKLLPNQYFDKYYKDDKDLKAFEQKLEGTYTGILYEEVEKKAEEHGYKIKMNQFLNDVLRKRFKSYCDLEYPGYIVP